MAKGKTIYFCQECGNEVSKWMGQCPACKAWNSIVEENVSRVSPASSYGKSTRGISQVKPSRISEITFKQDERMMTGINELDRVLGGGIVKGSLVLVGGDPGIGKSTLLLQMCKVLSNKVLTDPQGNTRSPKVLYISGEESLNQIKMRADRLGSFGTEIYLLCETNLDVIRDLILKSKPDIVIIDSIQTMFKEDIASAAGSVSQVRETTNILMHLAKEQDISIFIVGHVTKEGVVAGPRVLEHMVDTVLYFEGDRHASYRLLRAVKNRFGSTNEIGVFEMHAEGLIEVTNPSEYMLHGMALEASGSVVTCAMEGTRPILVEIQALVTPTNFQMPRRTAAGTDYNRVNLLLAVLEKRLGYQMGGCDAYVNIAGGMKLNEPSIDLAIVAALLSSYKNTPMSEKTMVFGEVGLTGEVRAVSMAAQRVQEAAKLGFKFCIVPEMNLKSIGTRNDIQVIGVSSVRDIIRYLQ